MENFYEEMELYYPLYRLKEGAKVVLAGSKSHEICKGKHGMPCKSDIGFQVVKENEFDALVIPGQSSSFYF
nr:DJ-1/PfpI family protein [Candidatus Protochlamydia sp. R18]